MNMSSCLCYFLICYQVFKIEICTWNSLDLRCLKPSFRGNICNNLRRENKELINVGLKIQFKWVEPFSTFSNQNICWTAYFALFQIVVYLSSIICFADSIDNKVWFINSEDNDSNYFHHLNSNLSLSGPGNSGCWCSS